MSKKKKTPKWMMAYATACRDLLGISSIEWDITVRRKKLPQSDTNRVNGEALIDHRYAQATLLLSPRLENNMAGHMTVMHEMLHIVTEGMRAEAWYMCQELPKKQRETAWARWKNAEERAVERLARALVQNIQPSEDHDGNE
jgi:hypothetical protein